MTKLIIAMMKESVMILESFAPFGIVTWKLQERKCTDDHSNRANYSTAFIIPISVNTIPHKSMNLNPRIPIHNDTV